MLSLLYQMRVNLAKCVLYCNCFIWRLSCTVVFLTRFVLCGCVYVWILHCVGVCICGCVCSVVFLMCVFMFVFCIVWMCPCAGYVMCGCVRV